MGVRRLLQRRGEAGGRAGLPGEDGGGDSTEGKDKPTTKGTLGSCLMHTRRAEKKTHRLESKWKISCTKIVWLLGHIFSVSVFICVMSGSPHGRGI